MEEEEEEEETSSRCDIICLIASLCFAQSTVEVLAWIE